MSRSDKKRDADAARKEPPRHPSYDPSGDEPAGSSSGISKRSFAGEEVAEAESEQARGRRESAGTRDTALGPPDQENDA